MEAFTLYAHGLVGFKDRTIWTDSYARGSGLVHRHRIPSALQQRVPLLYWLQHSLDFHFQLGRAELESLSEHEQGVPW